MALNKPGKPVPVVTPQPVDDITRIQNAFKTGEDLDEATKDLAEAAANNLLPLLHQVRLSIAALPKTKDLELQGQRKFALAFLNEYVVQAGSSNGYQSVR